MAEKPEKIQLAQQIAGLLDKVNNTSLKKHHFPGPNQPIFQDLTSTWFPHFVVPCCFFLALSIR